MPAIKIPRKSTFIDMTAMCDVAFLLLTFFILTAKFRPEQAVMIDIPTSRSMIKIEGAMTLSIDKDGKVYFSLSEGATRDKAMQMMIEKYGTRYPALAQLSEQQREKFALIEMLGFPVENLPQVLSLGNEQYKEVEHKMPGIPIDSTNNQLRDWIMAGRYANPSMKIAIKGDKSSNITAVKRVIQILTKDCDVHRFNLITTLEGLPAKTE